MATGTGYLPLLQVKEEPEEAKVVVWLLKSTRPLVLEGLDFEQPPKNPSDRPGSGRLCRTHLSGASWITNCRFRGILGHVGVDCKDLELRNCQFTPSNGAVMWQCPAAGRLTASGDVFVNTVNPLIRVDFNCEELKRARLRSPCGGHAIRRWGGSSWGWCTATLPMPRPT